MIFTTVWLAVCNQKPGSEDFVELARTARLRLLQMHYEAGVGHIGGNLSSLDVMLHLHHRVMDPKDVFVLAKGHAAGALYITLWTRGQLGEHELKSFHCDDTLLAGHPVPGALEGVAVATGSLGHGLPMAAGIALAKRVKGEKGRVFCLTSDGEWQSGSNWESLIFVLHQRLENLVILVDANGLQGFGKTQEIASMEPLGKRFEGFGIAVRECDGHNPDELMRFVSPNEAGPVVVVLRTVKGKGVSFMEDRLEWHYLPLDSEQYKRAMREIKNR